MIYTELEARTGRDPVRVYFDKNAVSQALRRVRDLPIYDPEELLRTHF